MFATKILLAWLAARGSGVIYAVNCLSAPDGIVTTQYYELASGKLKRAKSVASIGRYQRGNSSYVLLEEQLWRVGDHHNTHTDTTLVDTEFTGQGFSNDTVLHCKEPFLEEQNVQSGKVISRTSFPKFVSPVAMIRADIRRHSYFIACPHGEKFHPSSDRPMLITYEFQKKPRKYIQKINGFNAQYSPDGKLLAYMQGNGRQAYRLVVVDSKSRKPVFTREWSGHDCYSLVLEDDKVIYACYVENQYLLIAEPLGSAAKSVRSKINIDAAEGSPMYLHSVQVHRN